MLAPETPIADIQEAVTEVYEGRQRALIWTGTPIEPENWRFQLIIESGEPKRTVYTVRDGEDGPILGAVNKPTMLKLMELARVRLEQEQRDLTAQFADLRQQEQRLKDDPEVGVVQQALAWIYLRIEIIRDLLPAEQQS